MRLPFPPVGRKPPFPTVKIKNNLFPKSILLPERRSDKILDAALLSIHVLAESADAFPPLKSVVGGVRAICDIARRAKFCKDDATDIAMRTAGILDVIADAVPDGSDISQPMLESIQRFTGILVDIRSDVETITQTSRTSRIFRVMRHERKTRQIQARLDSAYQDFLVRTLANIAWHRPAAALRTEILCAINPRRQETMVQKHTDLYMELLKAAEMTRELQATAAQTLCYSRLSFF
ncbi:hypothetical protein R3P38DRAFT_2818583 [Favolaschia claudopus]|uniref:Uncharacterized protein n=1 Tax=Favolaschia claudopus TaxID=2862362 RepID=A0AAW0ED51_9AGAR